MYQKEVRYLLAKLQQWDVLGESRVSFDELYQVGRRRRVGLDGWIWAGRGLFSPFPVSSQMHKGVGRGGGM